MRQAGKKLKEVAQAIGGKATIGGLSGAHKELKLMLAGRSAYKNHNKTYVEAAKILREPVQMMQDGFDSLPWIDTTDRYQVMQNAFDSFQSAVTEYIKLEVESQVGKIEAENAALKKASAGLQSVVTAARQSNWADVLRTAFGGR